MAEREGLAAPAAPAISGDQITPEWLGVVLGALDAVAFGGTEAEQETARQRVQAIMAELAR